MIKINKRLTTISAFLNSNDKIIDIGCDHNLLAIYSYLNNGIKIIGSDNKKEPLIQAQNNLDKYGLSNVLSLRYGDGLEVVTDEIDTLIISGMGAMTIVNILEKINEYPNIKKIIVSPNNNFTYLREKLNKFNLKIDNEVIIKENNKYYLVISYIKGNEDINYLFGKLDVHQKDVHDYFQDLINKNNKIINNIKNESRIKELKGVNEQINNKINY